MQVQEVPKQLTGAALANAYAELKSKELGGKVYSQHNGRSVEIWGRGLPYHPQHPHKNLKGWNMSDKKSVSHCREYLANRGCMGQWHAFDPSSK